MILHEIKPDELIIKNPILETSQFNSKINGRKLYDFSSRNSRNDESGLLSGFQNPILANGLLGWFGANINVFRHIFSSQNLPEKGNLIAEIAEANLEYVTRGLPVAVINGWAEKHHREERQQHDQQRLQQQKQARERLTESPLNAVQQRKEKLVRHGGTEEVLSDDRNIVGMSKDNTRDILWDTPLTRRASTPWDKQSRIDSSMPIQQQLYYQQIHHNQQNSMMESNSNTNQPTMRNRRIRLGQN